MDFILEELNFELISLYLCAAFFFYVRKNTNKIVVVHLKYVQRKFSTSLKSSSIILHSSGNTLIVDNTNVNHTVSKQ